MVLHHCKVGDDQRCRHQRCVERNADPYRHDGILFNGSGETIQNTIGMMKIIFYTGIGFSWRHCCELVLFFFLFSKRKEESHLYSFINTERIQNIVFKKGS